MALFRFRAAAALDVRLTEERAALEARTRAEALFTEANDAVVRARDARAQAERDVVALAERGSDLDTLLWHRNWIVRLAATVDRLDRDREARDGDRHAADLAWRDARRRRLALERLRERAWQRFQAGERRQETRVMDELARIRRALPSPLEDQL
jgi:flagellar export protein FliJ